MKRLTIFLLCTVLLGCGSTPKTLNPAGEQYASENGISYNSIEFSVRSDNEEKSVEAGYMSNAAVREYMEASLLSKLEAQNLLNPEGLVLEVDLNISRVFSWGGSSMASIKYVARVNLKHGEDIFGRYVVSGQVVDNSIAGNFKTIFASNDSSEEGQYFEYIANKVMSRLPQH